MFKDITKTIFISRVAQSDEHGHKAESASSSTLDFEHRCQQTAGSVFESDL